ncbi:DUF2098 domain-containing protein [Methanobacterium oryzae]|uniref:DUF2098 domain-containing protein n=1 Tax=Methanobacterium oryzae TaxID=69540 RepID=UPI003D218FDD
MENIDACGKPIEKGSYVVYNGTGTMGKVIDVKWEDNGSWIKVDSTELWYNSKYIQTIDKIEEKSLEERKRLKEDIKERIKKRQKLVGEDVDMSTELCDGGG